MDYVINSSKKASLIVSEIKLEKKRQEYEDMLIREAQKDFERENLLFSKTIVKTDLPTLL